MVLLPNDAPRPRRIPISYENASGIARITFNAPELGNPINQPFLDQLLSAVRQAGRDRARVIVLASTGRLFSVGGDIAAFHAAADVGDFVDELAESIHRIVSELIHSPAVVVAGVQGMAAGASFPLVAAADVVVATRSARFMLGYTRIGFSVDGGTSLLVKSLGLHRVLAMALLNDALTAEEAHDVGLVARLVDDDELSAELDRVAAALGSGPRGAQASTKRLLRSAAESSPESLMRLEALSIREHASDRDGSEGIRAFLEKRPPVFGG